MSVLRDIATALRLLTIMPVPGVDSRGAAAYFSWVAVLYAALGVGIAAGIGAVARAEGAMAALIGCLVVTGWAALSGLLHWDGLADCADGLGVRGDAARRLQVMRESGIGAFGVVSVVLVALLQVTAVAAVVETSAWWTLAAAPVVGRWGAGLALMRRAPARPDGLGARYALRRSPAALALLTVPVALLAAIAPSLAEAVALVPAVAVAVAVPGVMARRLGGITGDVLGATIVLAEATMLVVGAIAGGL